MAKNEDDGFIDLGYSYDGVEPMKDGEEAEMHYPSITITCDEPMEFPEGDFMFTAKGRVLESVDNKRDPEDVKHRYEIQICCIKPGEAVEAEPTKAKDPVEEFEKSMNGDGGEE